MRTFIVKRAAVIGAAALLLAGCAGEPGPKTGAGAFSGAVAGGLIGAATGHGARGALTGAIIGGLVGGAVGNALDEQDRRRAYMAEMEALEYGGPGAPMTWHGDHGVYGTVVAGPAYVHGSHERCREYTHTIYIQGRPEVARGVACRNPDGTWDQVS